LTIPFIVFGKLNATDAIKSSCIIMVKKPFDLWALLIVAGLVSIVGIIGCGIGLFFTIPFLYSMTYAIYAAIIGFESNEVDENTESLNE
jgi:uncharacterized membrane protein